MFAKQTLTSASLVGVLLGVLAPVAVAEPATAKHADSEAAATPPTGLSDGAPAHAVVPGPPSATPASAPLTPPPPPKRRPTGWFQIGAGFQTDDGFTATAGVGQDSLFGSGKKLALTAAISQRRQSFVTSFVDPSLFGSQLSLQADLYSDRRLLPGMWRHASGASVTLSAPIAAHTRAFVGYRFEGVQVEPEHFSVARAVGDDGWNRYNVGALRAGLVHDTRDNPHAPRRGTYVGTSIEVADRDLGSDVQLLRAETFGELHQPIGLLTLHVSGRLSGVYDDHFDGNLAGIPAAERLYLDGSSELRGYRPGQLAPLGGTSKGVARAELEAPLFSRIGLSAVGFVDGAAISGDGHTVTGASAGFGLLWRSPIGPLRFDWAFPLDGDKPRFVFNVGL